MTAAMMIGGGMTIGVAVAAAAMTTGGGTMTGEVVAADATTIGVGMTMHLGRGGMMIGGATTIDREAGGRGRGSAMMGRGMARGRGQPSGARRLPRGMPRV